MDNRYIFPDTNIFLHFKPLNEVDLLKLIGCDEVEIVIAPVVIDELDRAKWDHQASGIRDRAKANARKISDWLAQGQPIRRGVSISLAARPPEEIFRKHQLDSGVGDDRLIASILEYQERYGVGTVVLLTADFGPQLRARSFGLPFIELPSNLELPPAQDAQKQEILKLQQQLARLQSRAPSLILTFEGKSDTLEIQLEPQLSAPPEGIVRQLEENMRRLKSNRYYNFTDEASSAVGPVTFALSHVLEDMRPSQEEVERYQREVEEYRNKYEYYLQHDLEVFNRQKRTIELNLLLTNAGTALAEDVVLTLTLPEKLYWTKAPSSEEFMPIPTPPKPPRNKSELMIDSFAQITVSQSYHTRLPHLSDDVYDISNELYRPVFEDTRLTWELGDLRHGSSIELEPLYVVFRDSDKISTFEFEVSIHEHKTPEQIKQKLLVRVVIT
jgi:hypothetical protein